MPLNLTQNVRLVVNVKDYRKRLDMTQEQLALAIGVSRKTINTIENGVFIPSTVLALALGSVLGATVEELFQLKIEQQEGWPAPMENSI